MTPENIAYPITAWATALGRDVKTIQAKFARADVPWERGVDIPAHVMFGVLIGDKESEQTRKLSLESDLLEIEKAKEEEKLLDPEVVNDRLAKCLGVIADYMRAAEVELPPACNPQDPEFARRAVVLWSKKFWPLVRGFSARPGVASPGEAWRGSARQPHGGVTAPEDFAVEPNQPKGKSEC